MKRLAKILALLSLGMGSLSYYRLKTSALDASILIYILKVLAGALASVLALMGLVGAFLGLLSRAPLAVVGGGVGAWLSGRYLRRVTVRHDGFEKAFGPGWQTEIPPKASSHLHQRRWIGLVPAPPKPCLEQDIPFWAVSPSTGLGEASPSDTAGDADRRLLCDVWQPDSGIERTGLAMIYLHPGGWQDLDKGTGTRPFFSYLAAQGHLVMDVSYRLCHETDMWGMIGDVKRAIAWMKANAGEYGVDPERVVASGGSAGGHLALLAGYTPNHPQLDPEDVRGTDTSVRAVISYYGPPDLRQLGLDQADSSSKLFVALGRKAGFVTGEDNLDWPDLWRKVLGGLPPEVPEVAALMSPITHVGPHCPPSLLLHGTHDRVIPVEDARGLYHALSERGVPVVYLELPQVSHAFDLALPQISPPAQSALYDVERFLALIAVLPPTPRQTPPHPGQGISRSPRRIART